MVLIAVGGRVAEILGIVELFFIASVLYILILYWLIFMIRRHILILELVVTFSSNHVFGSHNGVVSKLFSPSLGLTISVSIFRSPIIVILIIVVFIVIIVSTSRSFCYIFPEPSCHGWFSIMPPIALVLLFFKFSLALLHDFGLLPLSFLLGLLFFLLALSLRFFHLITLPTIALNLYKWSLWYSFYYLESVKYEGLRVVNIIVTTIIFS